MPFLWTSDRIIIFIFHSCKSIIILRFRLFCPLRYMMQYTNSNTRIPTASSPANTNNSSSSSNTNGGTSLQSSNQPTTSSPSSECQSATPAQLLSKTNLYIRGLNQNTTDKDLVTMCSQWVYYFHTCYFMLKRNQIILFIEWVGLSPRTQYVDIWNPDQNYTSYNHY